MLQHLAEWTVAARTPFVRSCAPTDFCLCSHVLCMLVLVILSRFWELNTGVLTSNFINSVVFYPTDFVPNPSKIYVALLFSFCNLVFNDFMFSTFQIVY